MENEMNIESEAQRDLELDAEAAEHVTGGRRRTKLRVTKTTSQVVPVASPAPASTPDDTNAPLPVIGDESCVPIHYGETQ